MYVQQDAQMILSGKMTYRWILVCTVLLTICPRGEGSPFNFNFRPEDFTFHDVEVCPPNTIFCMERRTCVNLDGTCIEPPTCNPDEIHQTDSFGLQQCVLFEDTCWLDEEEGCDVNGVLTCVPKGQCNSLKVTLRVDGDYTLVMSENYMDTIRHFKTQIAGETGLQPQQLMDFSVHPGSIYILFRAPLSAHDKLTFIANNKIQFLTDRSNNRLNIDWSQSWIEGTFSHEIEAKGPRHHVPGDVIYEGKFCLKITYVSGYYDGLQICKQGQLYCFQTKQCVNIDGTCPAEPVCSAHQILCNTDGKLECLDYGLCSYVGGYLYLSDANFDEVIGPDFENSNQFTDHLKNTLSNYLQVSTNNFWGFSFHRGSIGIFFFATLDVYQQLLEYKNLKEQFITDIDGNRLLIDWERSYVYEDLGWRYNYFEDCRDGYCIQCLQSQKVDWSRKECVPYDSIDDYWHIDSVWQQCKQGQFFCFETMRCINADGSCTVEPVCESYQMMCNTDGKLECVDHGSCSYAESYLYLIDANFDEVIGPEFENAKQFTDHLKNILSNSLQVPTDQFWDFRFERGSIGIFFSATVDIYNKLVEYKSHQEQFITDIDGNQLQIDWERSYIYEHSGWSDEYYGDCRDGYCIHCLPTQTIDWSRKECVPYDYLDDSWQHDSYLQQCSEGQFFCFETLRCINADGSCPGEPICESHQTLCNTDGSLECVEYGTCSYVEGFIYLENADFRGVIGHNFENLENFANHFKKLLASELSTSVQNVWGVRFEEGSIGIHFSTQYHLYDIFLELMNSQLQFISDLNETPLHINWEHSFVNLYEASDLNSTYSWLDNIDHGYNDGPDFCPDCHQENVDECGSAELFCFETLECVANEGICTDAEFCPSPDEVLCQDEHGNYVCQRPDSCYSDGDFVSVDGVFTFDADYEQYMTTRGYFNVIHDIKDAISELAAIDSARIHNVTLRPGSIIAEMTFVGLPEELKAVIQAIHNHILNDGNIFIGGMPVQILNFISDNILDEGGHDSFDNESGHDLCTSCYHHEWKNECDDDQLFCFETLQCVTNEGACSDAGLCLNPLEAKCPDGKGGYICVTADQCDDMNTLKTTEVSIVLDGDYTTLVEGRKENVMNELQMSLPSQLNIDASLLNVRDLAMGSIVITAEIGPASVEVLNAYITILKTLEEIKGTIVISGTPLTIISVDVLFFPGDPDGGHYDSGDNMPTCHTDQIFCLGKSMCVAKDNDISSCNTEYFNCSDSEEFCLDENGYGTCVTLDTCSIKLATVSMLTDGDYETLKGSETIVLGELKPQIAALLDIKVDSVKDMRSFQGSFGIEIDIYPVDAAEMEPRLQALENKIMQSEVLVSMLGTTYIVRPESFSVFVELGNPTGCEGNASCVQCLDHETQCENLGDTESVTCVPKDICLLAPVCPVPEKDTLSTCQYECDPKTDTAKATGELCCPNACGGGVYLAVKESYLCPRDEITGACLTLEDTQCEIDTEWCTVSFSCETRENCGSLAKQQTDKTVASERFILLIRLITKWESSVVIFKTHDSDIQFFQEALIEFETSAKLLLVDELTSVEDKISLGNVFVYTENKDLHQLTIYADLVSEIPGTVTVEEIREKVKNLTFTTNRFPEISHVPEDDISVVPAKDNAERQLFILPEPVVSGTVASFALLSVIPNDLFISPSVEATLNCSGQTVELFIDGTGQQTADISSGKNISVKHEHQEITLSKCRVTSKQFKEYPDGRQFYIGFIVIPKPIEDLGTTHIELNEDISTETEEDISECISLPDNLLVLKSEGDALFDIFRKWPEHMTELGEIWHTAKLPVAKLIQNLLQSYQLTRSSEIQSFLITASVDQPAAAVIYYKNEPLRPDVTIDLMTNVQKMQDLEICISADYSGLFNLVVTPIQSGTTGGNKVFVPIHVTDRNDPPFFLLKEFSQAIQEFAHPAFSINNTDEMTVSVFVIGDILSVLATDVDSEKLGMALLGYLPTSLSGTWQYSKDGITWEDLNEITVDSNDDINVTAALLRPEDKIRYTTSENGTWKFVEAPKLAFLAWDLTDVLNIESNFTNLIALTRCNILAKGLKQYCRQDDDNAYSTEIVVLPLARMGCDGVANSGLENLRCGCGDDTSCLDCHNVPNGGVVVDKCGVCGGTNILIDCNVTECRQNKSLYCTSKDAFLENVGQMCDEGQELVFLEYSQYCEDRCIENGQDIRQVCSIPCDILECLDCANEVGKNDVNPCGQCKPIASLNEGCETIGLIQPPVSVPKERLTLTLEVVSSLVQGDTPVIECILENKDPALTGTQVPEVISTSFQPGSEATAPSVVLDLQIALDDSDLPVFGEFAVTCKINNKTVSTADADQYFLLYDIPELESVTPEYASVAELSEVTVTGSGILDTGKLLCVIRCLDIEECEFRAVKGVRLSETQASCPMNHLLSLRIGQEYFLFVILDELSNIESSWLTQTKSVRFSVVMPAPTVISADLNKDECSTVTVEFDTRVSGVDESGCSFYFTSPLFSAGDGTKCILPKGSKYLYIQNVNGDIENQQLIFKSNVIKNAAEKNTVSDMIHFLSGSVTVQGEEVPSVEIDPRIPGKVGCTAVTMRPVIKNKGCWEIKMSWTVTAEGADAAHISALQSAIGKNISFQITGSQLQDELAYTFTLNWQAGDFTGTYDTYLMKDSESTSFVSIYGIQEEHDVAETISVKAIIRPCDENDYNIEISWALTPAVAILQYTGNTFTRIPEGSLQPLSSYELSCSVKFGNGETVTVSAPFKTRALPIKAGIRFNDDISTNLREVGEDANVTLACINLEDIINENENTHTCTWTCQTNLLGDTEDQMFPCLMTKDSQLVQLELFGQTITSKGADRLRPPKSHNLIEKWTVIMELDGQTSTASKMFKYKYVPVELSAPEIEVKRKDNGPYYVSEDVTRIKIETYCRRATSYKWVPSDDDGLSVLTPDVFVGMTEKNIEYSDIYKDCSIELDFSSSTGNILTPGELYAINIAALNMKEGLFLSSTDQVSFQYVQRPLNGIVEVMPEAEVLVAWTTKVIVSLTGWWDSTDGTNLRCHLYYYNLLDTEGSVATRLTTLPMNLEESFTFTLPEGRFKIESKCCNKYYMCSVSEADEEVQVQSAASSDIVTTLEQDIQRMTAIESDAILGFLGAFKSMLGYILPDESEAEKAASLIIKAVKQSLTIAFAKTSDRLSKLAVIEQVPNVVSPNDLDSNSKSEIQGEVTQFVKDATGKTDSGRKRKRRSTLEFSNAIGLTEEEATAVLNGFEATISQNSISKSDADSFKDLVDDVMLGMCQAFTGSTPWVAPAKFSYLRVQKTSLAGYASTYTEVSCSDCSEVDYPATVNYGQQIETRFNDSWDCIAYTECTDVCVATAQLNVDIFTPTVGTVVAPTRMSDIILLKMINPKSYEVEDISDLNAPVEASLTLNGTIDMETYEYKCLMWVSDDWSDVPCDTSTPTLDENISQYKAVCSCKNLGVISIFQVFKQGEETTTTASTSTSSLPDVSSTTPAPSKSLKEGTDFTKIQFKFTNEFEGSVGSKENELKDKIKQDIIEQTGFDSESIRNLQISPGSILVTFELYKADTESTLGQMIYKLEDMINGGSITFSTTDGTPLNLKPGSFTYEEVDSDNNETNTSDSNNLLVIIGGALGGLVVICVTTIIVFLIVKSKKQRTHPTHSGSVQPDATRYNTPPPTYTVAPPPPYMYVDPPKVNKWVENELQNDKKSSNEKRPASNASNGSGSSYDHKVKNKALRSEPTPVGE